MNCIYCNEPCHMEGLTFQIMFEPQDEIWVCSNHPITVKHYIKFVRKKNCKCGEWADQNCCPREEFYKTILEVPKKDTLVYLVILEDGKLYVQSFNGIQAWSVLHLDPAPSNLTPENIQGKLPLWITFS